MTTQPMTTTPRLADQRWARITAAAVIALGVVWIEQHISVATSPSIDHRIFWRTDGVATQGEYVNFVLQHPLLHAGKPQRVIKQIKCAAGDALQADGMTVYCNGELIAVSKQTLASGQELPAFRWQGPIPAGKAFVLGTHRDSFDSRYWGFVDVARTERLVAIF